MTSEAVLLEACARLGIQDPAEFYLLPSTVQALWLEHTANTVSGAYFQKREHAPSTAEQAIDAERKFLEAQARRRAEVADGPR